MKNQIILFDLDGTIFDTGRMMKIFRKKILKLLGNPDSDKFRKAEDTYRLEKDREFLPETYIKTICDAFNFPNRVETHNIFYDKKNQKIYAESVYPKVRGFLLRLIRKNFKLGIFSEGTKRFQNHKFNSTGLIKYLDKDLIFILPAKDKSEVLNKIPKQAIIIDNKLSICEYLYQHQIKVIWLNKKDLPDSKDFTTIHNLLELDKILI